MSFHHELLRDYIAHYQFEKERLKRVQALQDEVQARATQIIIEYMDFEIREAEKEIDLFLANSKHVSI